LVAKEEVLMKMKKIWCDECKFMVFNCRHLEGRDASEIVPADMPRDPGKRELVFLAINGLVPGTSTMNLSTNPQIIVKPRRLVVDPNVAPFFQILDIKIGHNSQFASSTGNGVSASIFPPTPEKYQPVANLDGLPVITVGQHLIFSVYNKGGALQEFNALIWCDHVLEDSSHKVAYIPGAGYLPFSK
jgi:hypothetical protein